MPACEPFILMLPVWQCAFIFFVLTLWHFSPAAQIVRYTLKKGRKCIKDLKGMRNDIQSSGILFNEPVIFSRFLKLAIFHIDLHFKT
jgi:hypothetical protein